MAQSKIKLNQFIQDGASDGQVITWDNTLGLYKPVTLNTLYTGSGTIPASTVATFATGTAPKFRYQNGINAIDFTSNFATKIASGDGLSIGFFQDTSIAISVNAKGLSVTETFSAFNNKLYVNTTGGGQEASAALQVLSTTGLLYPPIMTGTQRDAITPINGGILYNSTVDKFQGRQAGAWVDLGAGGGGGSVATDAIWDAKGDLAVGTGADTAAKLTVGTNGQGIFADSAASTGLRWGPKIISPAQITADQDDYNPTGWADANIVRLDFDANIRAITSFASTFDGDIKTLINISDNTAYIPAQHPDGTAANRVDGQSTFLLYGKQAVNIVYDGTSSRWRILNQEILPLYKKAMCYNFVPGSVTAADIHDYQFLAVGSGAIAAASASAGVGGKLKISSAASATGGGYLHSAESVIQWFRSSEAFVKHTTLLSIDILSDVTDNFSVYSTIDATPAGAGENNNSVGFRYTHGLNAGNWTAFSKSNAGVLTQVDTGVAVAADTLYLLEVILNKDCTEALFFIDGVYKARVNTNMPAVNTLMGTRVSLQKASGTAARTVDIHSTSSYAIWK